MSRITWETETCSRCGGTGTMPFAVYGGKCFKCNGTGKQLTRAGSAARNRYLKVWNEGCDARRVTVADLQAGDKITGVSKTSKVYEVVAVEADRLNEGRVMITTKFVQLNFMQDATVVRYDPAIAAAAVDAVRKLKGAIITEA